LKIFGKGGLLSQLTRGVLISP